MRTLVDVCSEHGRFGEWVTRSWHCCRFCCSSATREWRNTRLDTIVETAACSHSRVLYSWPLIAYPCSCRHAGG
jgi:hypothetical protein